MIAEIGHYALVLALALALIQSVVPLIGARTRDAALMAVAEPAALAQFGFVALSFRDAGGVLRHLGFLGPQRVREFALRDAADLQVHQHVGQPRRLDAAVGADPVAVRRAGGGVRQQHSALPQGDRAVGPGLDRGGLLPVHPDDLQPVPALRRRRRSRAAISIRCCRTSASPSIRRCSISAMSASRSRSRSRSRR